MTKVVIHQPKNFESRYYRFYNYVFDGLAKKISENFDSLEARYFKHANATRYPIKLMYDNETKEKDTTLLLECEMLIENYDTHEVIVLSVSDDLTHAILHPYPKLKKVFISQFNRDKIQSHLINGHTIEKYSPWVYFPQNLLDYDTYYNLRKSKEQFIDKIYFRGTSLECRSIIEGFNTQYFEGGLPLGGFDVYARDITNYKAAFSVAGRGEFCYRDIENMAMGIPIIRFEFSNEMSDKLIPNFHYISVPRPSVSRERDLTPEHAKLIENKFLEVKDDLEFLNFISKNAREYYEKHVMLDNCIEYTYNLIGIEDWKNNNNNIMEVSAPQAEIPQVEPPQPVVEDNNFITKKVDLEACDGLSSFKNFACQQHHGIYEVFYNFLNEIKPKNILEIGTALGGFTSYLKYVVDQLGIDTYILSYDIHRMNWYEDMCKTGIDVRVENVFNENYSEVKPEVTEYIRKPGTTIVFCDGGSKKDEFNLLSNMLKKGDFILAHDYGYSKEVFDQRIYKKIWNWCEITEKDIEGAVARNNLIDYKNDIFNNVAWTCKVKI